MQPKLRKNRLGKTWGFAQAKLDPTSLSALKLKYCLEALETVHGKVLEVGCGAGMFTIAIKKAKHRANAIFFVFIVFTSLCFLIFLFFIS